MERIKHLRCRVSVLELHLAAWACLSCLSAGVGLVALCVCVPGCLDLGSLATMLGGLPS